MTKVLILGSTGMLGHVVTNYLKQKEYEVYATSRNTNDEYYFDALKDVYSIEKILTNVKPDFIINCIGILNKDAEEHPSKAIMINSYLPHYLDEISEKYGFKLIHVSTDYVFDGSGSVPYTEETEKCPKSVYGITKANGEDAVAKEMTQYYIIRTAWLYGFDGKNFVYTMTKAMNSRPEVKVVADQKGTPTCAVDLASAIIKIITTSQKAKSLFGKNSALPYGIYHFTNLGETTWYDFTRKIYEFGKKYSRITQDCTINSCTTEEYPTKATRPAYSVLSKDKIMSLLKFKIPAWEDSLEKFIKSNRFEPK